MIQISLLRFFTNESFSFRDGFIRNPYNIDSIHTHSTQLAIQQILIRLHTLTWSTIINNFVSKE
jgi:hypothetical protein